ncbi:protein cordon-bleu isoform X7 [Peromyscus californicus insignis]|uniref:protein cordon-bleu isoform X7 n=1 Tax=Peromyscus californicus insignis TaxID=564181 RepID=UPI0022A66EF7|nr:protein cordon-bleu isoform X7 [Peromyscus californicus insignis]
MSLRKMKARAPPPPGKPTAQSVHSEQKLPHDATLGSQQSLVHMKEGLQNSTLDITVVLPSGLEKQSVVSGSHAMMDLLVDLCLQNHLNPSHHVLEIWSSETQQPLSFKPNTLIGSLNIHTVLLKEKVPEEKLKPGLPKVPEKSVRLVVNYLRTQKAVVRVSPEVPLQNILPVICAKCEVNPDHVVLLRDNVAGEELELSKSLNELGIKELYAWDNRRVPLTKTQSEPSLSCQEVFRKSSLGNDETDKEKKKFLGFFKVNKRSSSKAEHLGLSGADSDEDPLKSASGGNLNGCLTTPNSPSMHSRSLTLGPSLSLGNISGVSMKSEMKKRRAPPPPSPGPLGQDKTSEKASLSSQADLQKKKRRAPAPPPQPPPPSPVVPSRKEDKEENRKSTVVSLPLGPGSHCSMGGVSQVPPEAEETASVGSCFASEDTTEDSGVMSSPSDVISLDSQQDSMRSKDKWATDQEDCSDQDLAGTPELAPQKSPSRGKNGSGNSILRNEKVTMPPNDDEDLFITGHLHQTLAELDGDLEGMEENYETDTSSLTSSINGVSNHSLQEAIIPDNGMDDIPITFIGEVSDEPVDSGLFPSRSNNAATFNTEGIASQRSHLSPFQTEHSQPHVRTNRKEPDPSPPSQDVRKRNQSSTLANTSEDENLMERDPRGTSFVSKLFIDDLKAKDKGKGHGSTHSQKTQAGPGVNSLPVNQKDGEEENPISALPLWSQHGQASGGSYGLKYGLTTYKIVPPKSEMRYYDRDVSLSTGAIKIDELGNLVSPHMNGSRTISRSSAVVETDAQPIGKVKEFWRRNSMEKYLNGPAAECTAKSAPSTATTATPAKPQQENGLKATFTTPTPQQQPAPQEYGAHLEEERSRPRSAVSCHVKVPAANPAEVTFLKPQRRTSSQYVASAIAKKMGPPRVHADVVRPHKKTAEKGREEPKLVRPPPTGKDDAAPNQYSEARQHEPDTNQGSVCLSSNPGVHVPAGDHPRVGVSSPYGKPATQDCPAAVHRNSNFLPVRSSQRDRVSVGPSCGFNEKQTISNQKTSSTSNPTRAPDRTHPHPPPPLLAEARDSGRILMNGSARAPGNCEPPHCPKESSPTSYIILQTEEKPSPLTTDVQDTDDVLPSSIFGPKKKFKPVVQRPVPKDTSLHSALMEAIHSSGGRDKLRKTAEHTSEGRPKKPSYTETESERSALLAAIRGHSGTLSLRKVSSLASEELQNFRDAALLAPGLDKAQQEDHGLPPPPVLPPPPPPAPQAPSASITASRFSTGTLSNTVDARQALMDAIRSGTGAARLRKVPLLV